MITKVKFQNFKALRDVEIDLERFTVFVGANASGKTSILEALSGVSVLANPQQPFPFQPARCYSRSVIGDLMLYYWTPEGGGRIGFPRREQIPLEDYPSNPNLFNNWIREFDDSLQKQAFSPAQAFPNSTLLKLDPQKLRETTISKTPVPRMEADGTCFASTLAFLMLNQPERFNMIEKMVCSIIPQVVRIRFEKKELREVMYERDKDEKIFFHEITTRYFGESLMIDFVGAKGIPSDQISEGTILVLAVLTGIMQASEIKLILLDDIDSRLHPSAQRTFITHLRKLLEADPNLQIVATTHSPYLLDEVDPREIRVTTLDDTGAVVCGRIEDHPKFPRWKEAMTPGEFWSFIGEKWLLEKPQVNGEKKDLAEVHGS